MALVAENSVATGKITRAKPSSVTRASGSIGVRAPLDPVEQQRRVRERPGNLLDLRLVLRRLHEEHVGAGVAVGAGPVEGGVQTLDRPGVRTGDEHKAGVGARLRRRVQLVDHLPDGHDPLAGHVPAPLGRDLVLQVKGGDAGPLELLHGSHDVRDVCRSRCRRSVISGTVTAPAIRAALSTISVAVSRPTSGMPRSPAVAPNPVM